MKGVLSYRKYIIQLLVLFVIYFITAKIGLGLNAVSGFATLIWAPAGIALAALLIGGFNLWPAIFLAAFSINIFTGASFFAGLGIAIGNTLEAYVGAYILKRGIHIHKSLNRLRDVLGLIIYAAVGSTLLSATIGTTSLFLSHNIDSLSYFRTWTAWWVGDMLGILIVTPVILTWSRKSFIKLEKYAIFELIFVIACLFIVSIVVFHSSFNTEFVVYPFTYIVFPFLIWIALRFSPRETSTVTLFLSVIAIWGTLQGKGPFATPNVSWSLLLLQLFVFVIAGTSLILAAAVAERKQLERRKDEFVAVASHELKTPVTSLKAFTQILQKRIHRTGDKDNEHLLININNQIDRLTYLINDLLAVSKINTGKLEYHKSLFDLDELVTKVVSDFRYTADKHQILKKGTVTKQIYGDSRRIEQVLTNLINNAIKYSPQAKTVIVSLEDTGDHAIIQIRDFGFGITEEDKKRIFERFYRIPDRKNQNISGFGLGLYIASAIVKKHHGKIWAENITDKDGSGSVFTFTLPYTS